MATSAPTVQNTLRGALESAHQILERTMADVTDEIAARPGPGNANPIGSSYAHAVLAEDGIVNGMLRGQAPLFASAWAGRTGTDQAMPMPGGAQGDLGTWYRSVRVDVGACREYAQAVYASSADFIGSADDATLARAVDLSMIGMGTLPLSLVFAVLVIGHCNNLCGEISAIKGSNGLRGYPF